MSAGTNRLGEMSPPLGGEMRDYLGRHRAELEHRLVAGVEPQVAVERRSKVATVDGMELGRAHAKIVDGLMMALFAAARASSKRSPPAALALAAVGSYGRGAVALRSDADVRMLVPSRGRAMEEASELAEALLYPMWDAGMSVGHQVTTCDDVLSLAQTDLATATTLLDLRFLAGDSALVDDLVSRAYAGLFSEGELARFMERLEEEAAARHTRFGGSVYLLEPDVKNGAGGLRDLDIARWAAQARFRPRDASHGAVDGERDPLGMWGELVRLGVLVPREAREIARAEDFLWRVRNRLHARASRRIDRLTFDDQETIGAELGLAPSGEPPDSKRGADIASARAAETLMQEYYRCARVVTRAREQITARATPPKRRGKPVTADLGHGILAFDGHVTLESQDLAKDPALALRLYATSVRTKMAVLPFAREAIARASADPAWAEALRASREAAELFVELVSFVPDAPVKSGSVLRELHDVGLLLAMVPEFAPVTGRVHHDVYHVYTVDAHSVAAVDCLRALCRGELSHEHPLASRLAAEIARPAPLFLATLLHDVGKGYPDADGSRKNHSKTGADLCDQILPRLGLSKEDTAHAHALVLQHLAMYHTATRRDLEDELVCAEFSKLVTGREGLRDLYLLTVVDLGTTSPTALTSWKSRMLEELYFASDGYLAGHKGAGEERAARVRKEALAAWRGQRGTIEAYLSSMPERYTYANDAAAIVEHAKVVAARGNASVHAALVPSRHPEVCELVVVADDKPGLLASVAAAITAGRLEVLAAEVYSRATPRGESEAVDVFWVRDRTEGAAGVSRAMPRLIEDLRRVCESAAARDELARERFGASPWRERPSPAILADVTIDDRASPRHTVIEVFAKDRPGLLYTLAREMHGLGLSIALSKINTEGTKVADVFYVNEIDGAKVLPGERFKTIRERLLAAVTDA